MPSVTYMNQSAPFWDFVANLEQQGRSHPFFNQNQNQDENTDRERGEEFHPFGPWGWGYPRGFPFRGPPSHGPPPHGPPPHEHDENAEDNEKDFEKDFERELEKEIEKEKGAEDNNNGEGPSNNSASETEGWSHRRGGRHGRCGGRRERHEHWGRDHHHRGPPGPCGRGGRGGFGGPRHGPPHHGPHRHGGRGGWGSWGGRGGPFEGGPFNPFAFAAGLFDPTNTKDGEKDNETQDFTPEADIFDTTSSFVVHVSLPGAKKEDVGVNWDAEKSELSVAGVIYRPGDEEFLKTLAMDERKVGPFERKIRLGTRANPAQIDAEGISAKLEDGILRVDVPKMETEFVEIRKVDIE